jgi:hypothetical protein
MLRNVLREPSAFRGRCLVIFGGWNKFDYGVKRVPLSKENVYKVDSTPYDQPDAVLDVTDRNAWKSFKDGSFDFIWIPSTPFLKDIKTIFEECRRMLSENGVIFYRGGFDASATEHHSIPQILAAAGFPQSVFWIPPAVSSRVVEKWQLDKGTISFASKSKEPLEQAFLQKYLTSEPLEIIQSELLFNQHYFQNISLKDKEVYGITLPSTISLNFPLLTGFPSVEMKPSQPVPTACVSTFPGRLLNSSAPSADTDTNDCAVNNNTTPQNPSKLIR